MNSFVLQILLALFTVETSEALYDLTGINCISIDKPFADFEYCNLKIVNRNYKYYEVKVKLFKVPINNVTVKLSIMKKSNGYKPFLYSITVDGCKFLKNRKRGIVSYFFALVKEHSNMNHSCPFDHDLILSKLDTTFLNSGIIKMLPLPDGEYALFTTWIAYNKPRAHANFYYTHKT